MEVNDCMQNENIYLGVRKNKAKNMTYEKNVHICKNSL